VVDGRGVKTQEELGFLYVTRSRDHAQLRLLNLPGPGGNRDSRGD